MGRRVVLVPGILRPPRDLDLVASALRAAGFVPEVAAETGHDWSPQALAEALRPRLPAHLVGHSRGGTAASWLAAESPELVESLALVCSPPQPGEAFRAHFRARLAEAKDEAAREALAYLARMPEDDFPMHALRRYRRPALVVEAGDDPLYSPTHTLFWRAFLPFASMERTEGGHAFFAKEPGASWLAARLARHLEEAERA